MGKQPPGKADAPTTEDQPGTSNSGCEKDPVAPPATAEPCAAKAPGVTGQTAEPSRSGGPELEAAAPGIQ